MITLPEFQHGVAKALLGDEENLIEGDFAEGPVSVTTGTAVYRNNVFAALTKALGDLYPVVKQLVGDGFFAYAANDFVIRNPPNTPVLVDYGDGFPDFLDDFEAAASLPYLGDEARFELARHQALHSPDADSLRPEALKKIPQERLGDIRFRLHPSARLLRSPYPVDAIWEAHQDGAEPDETLTFPDHETCLLVARPEMTVKTMAFAAETFDFIIRLCDGEPLDQAFAATGGDWDPERALSDLLVFGAFINFSLSGEK
jgi:hypothetical protein